MSDKRKISPLMLLPPLIFAALAILFYVGVNRDEPNALPSTLIGKPAPLTELVPLGDVPAFPDAALREGGMKLVNYWASWCAPCRQEHPVLKALADEGVTIYGINYKDTPAKALRFLDELGNPYAALAADPSGRTAIEWGVYGVPETYLLDGAGRILLRVTGPVTPEIAAGRIRPALETGAAQ